MISKRIAAVMIDLSGTVHVGQNLLPGVKEAVDLLRENRVNDQDILMMVFTVHCPGALSFCLKQLQGAGVKGCGKT